MYRQEISATAPQSFEPRVLDPQESYRTIEPAQAPKPFRDTRIFEHVDTHAVEVSQQKHSSFKDLVWHLIYARGIEHELEKARAIFLWLCSKDLDRLTFDNVRPESPEEILMDLKTSKATYAHVFKTLCSYAGMHCQIISGYAKGAEYTPGMIFTGTTGQHSWNAVMIEGTWRLVDCHWAARRLVGKKVTIENVRYELDEYYFMPAPSQLIFTHFPETSNWQLLENPILKTDFENLVPVKSTFFKYQLSTRSHKEAVIDVRDSVTIHIGISPDMIDKLSFTMTLTMKDGLDRWNNIELKRFCMHEVVGDTAYFTIRPPAPGSYSLILYAKEQGTEQSGKNVYGGICDYEINVLTAKAQPFPHRVSSTYGGSENVAKYNIKSTLESSVTWTQEDGIAEIPILISRPIRFNAKLKAVDSEDEKSLINYVLHRIVKDTAIFCIAPPRPGEYALEIYANDQKIDGNSLLFVYQFLIICEKSSPYPRELPPMQTGYLGPQMTFNRLGIDLKSHPDPYLITNSDQVAIEFALEQPLRFTSQLLFVSNGRQEDITDYILHQGTQQNITLVVRLPRGYGFYKLQLYALPYSDASDNLPGIFNYLIECRSVNQNRLLPFPKQFGQWKEGCILYEPLDGILQSNSVCKFSIRTPPGANSVAVVVDDDWKKLELDNDGVWSAQVVIQGRKVPLCANYSEGASQYSTLLEFDVN